ncbi:MAG: ABC transporter permease [Opitutae bacterium]|nr:ABC transporter permease [Opitutae bacterium]
MLPDLRFAFRSLSKTPGFTTVAVLTMAIAIGACTALFSVLQAVVLRPLPYPNLDTLVSIWAVQADRNLQAPAVSWDKYLAFRERKDVFADIALLANNGFTLTAERAEPEQVTGLHVSANFLPVLGLAPLKGRNFTVDEDRAGGAPVVMISARLWRNRFGGAADVIGRTLQVDGVAREVIGVLPDPMPVPFNGTDVVVTAARELPYLTEQQRNFAVFHGALARLAPGVTREQANLRLTEMSKQFAAAHAGHLDAPNANEARPIAQQVLGNLGQLFWTLAGAVAAVLLIACANIANLFLARVSARQKEIAVRMSLGARPSEVVRQFLIESLAFTAVAASLGVLLAWWSLRGIELLAGPQLPRGDEIALDPGVLTFSVVVALLASLVVGLYPALQASRTDVGSVLKDNTRGAGGGTAAKTFRHALVVAQVALSLCLLIGAGLLVLSFSKLNRADPGFATEGRAFGGVSLPTSKYDTPERVREFHRRLQEQLRQTPELQHGGLSGNVPLAGGGFLSPYTVKGRPIVPFGERPLATISNVSVDYFATLGIKLKAGRFFADTDTAQSEQVCLINETLAKKLFPNSDPLNESFVIGPKTDIVVRIVGVVKDVKTAGLNAPAGDEIYYPFNQRGPIFTGVVGHAQPGLAAAAVIPALRRAVAAVDPNVALANVQTMPDLLTQSLGVQRVTMSLLLVFAAIAALLAAVGVYSIMAYAVTQRTGEIGVRLALGASERDILGLILRGGAWQVGLGLLLGVAGALASSRLLEQALYEVKPFDPLVFSVVGAGFAAVALLACLIPARRAMRVDPMIALRAE